MDVFMSMLARSVSDQVISFHQAYDVAESDFQLEIVFNPNFSFDDFKEAALFMEEKRAKYGYVKVKVVFNKHARIYYRKKYREVKEVDLEFFVGGKSEELCYTTTGRSGYYVYNHMDWQSVERMILIHKNHPDKKREQEVHKDKLFKRILNARFDEQTWSNLKKEDFSETKHPFYYIDKVFDPWEMEQIKKAFEEKASFRITKRASSPRGRDFRAEGKMCDDGIYRAWFSSEYAGCANGDYYLLLNPRVAVFYERD